MKADDLVPEDNDYLRDLGSRRSKRPEDVKENDSLDVDDLGGIFYIRNVIFFFNILLSWQYLVYVFIYGLQFYKHLLRFLIKLPLKTSVE